jgi:catechol 2,3-dioxygenase-like lactoylglutathione lyase family enzyme
MKITLDHTVVACRDGELAASRFAEIMGLRTQEREGVDGKFVPVRVNTELRVFFVSSNHVMPQHLAFAVDDPAFEGILERLRRGQIPFGDSPHDARNGRIGHPFASRGLFWADDDGHLFEVMATNELQRDMSQHAKI